MDWNILEGRASSDCGDDAGDNDILQNHEVQIPQSFQSKWGFSGSDTTLVLASSVNSQPASHPILSVQGPQARAASRFPLPGSWAQPRAYRLSGSPAGRLSPLLLRVADKEDRPLCLLWPSLRRSRPPSGGPVSSGNRLSVCQDTITFLQPEATPGWVGVGWTDEEETGQLQASLFPGASSEEVHWGDS